MPSPIHPRILGLARRDPCDDSDVPAGARHRVRADVVRLSHRGLSVPDFARAATRALRRAVPFDGVCVLTLDPATLLPTSEHTENALPPAAIERLNEIELGERDVNSWVSLARGRVRAASLSGATGGRLRRSLRQRELREPSGFDDELRALLADESGAWGALTLLRGAGASHFTAAEVRLVDDVAGELARGLRRSILLGALAAHDGAEAEAGLLVLAADGALQLANAAADRWLAELAPAEGSPTDLPRVVKVVAAGARRAAAGDATSPARARARIRTGTGRWAVVHGSLLGDGPEAPVAVTIEAARGAELARLIADAYDLTEREREITQLVAQGLPTDAIARRLLLSPYTVQDHLKAIFGKTGCSSRGELVARLFFDHYAPRLSGGAPLGETGWFAAG